MGPIALTTSARIVRTLFFIIKRLEQWEVPTDQRGFAYPARGHSDKAYGSNLYANGAESCRFIIKQRNAIAGGDNTLICWAAANESSTTHNRYSKAATSSGNKTDFPCSMNTGITTNNNSQRIHTSEAAPLVTAEGQQSLHSVLAYRGEGGGSTPLPKFQRFDKAEPNSQLRSSVEYTSVTT
jgi:hypothetical protein